MDLVLLGGGHAHVHVLRRFGMRPVPGLRVTLVTRDLETPYSGMLPGLVAGRYRPEDCHIDLMRLARFAGARLVHAEAAGIDRAAGRVPLKGRPPLRYDLLSVDIGSVPRFAVPGAAEHALPVRPVAGFLAALEELTLRARNEPLSVAVVGGGAGGVELALALRRRLSGTPRSGPGHRITLVTRGRLLENHGAAAARLLRAILRGRQIELVEDAEIVRVEAAALVAGDGRRLPVDRAIWATGPGAPAWLGRTGLRLDADGFIAVDETFRSVDDPAVFAAGDVATMTPHPRPKAGVFAVRAGPPLAANLRLAALGRAPRRFRPQRKYLALIGTGDGGAVALRGRVAVAGRWLWTVKDRIDRRWIRRYRDLPAMTAVPAAPPAADAEAMRCGGCGAKVPEAVLSRVLARLHPAGGPHVAAGLEAPDDAALLRPPPGEMLLQTVDFFRAFVDDPYLFGRIAAAHALGDIHAMGGRPIAALAIAGLPPAAAALVEEDLFQMLRGALDVLEPEGAVLAGGHSAETAEPSLGFAVTGAADEARLLRKGGLRPGDRLILTRPLGTGTLLAAAMQGRARAGWIAAALAGMQCPAGEAADCLRRHGATACTDVTGFGLAGHLLEMLRASDADAVIDADAVPALDGALETIGAGIVSSLHPGNAEARRGIVGAGAVPAARLDLLFDPQTAGGLLAGVPAAAADSCLAALRRCGSPRAAVIGTVVARRGGAPAIVFRQTAPAGV